MDVAKSEPFGANVLRLPGVILASAAFPITNKRIQSLGLNVIEIDVSELQKAESGVTCMSLPFTANA